MERALAFIEHHLPHLTRADAEKILDVVIDLLKDFQADADNETWESALATTITILTHVEQVIEGE